MSSKLQEIANTKEKILEKILKIDPKSSKKTKDKGSNKSSSYPETHVITNIQYTIKSPLFNLSIADYELMCGNEYIIEMMTKVLECNKKQLKKFCKYINVFKENIDSSPKSIKNKMKPNITLNKLPEDIKIMIVNKYKSIFPKKETS